MPKTPRSSGSAPSVDDDAVEQTVVPAPADDTDVTPLDGDRFLEANRTNREKFREAAERRDEREASRRERKAGRTRRRIRVSARRSTILLAVLSALVVLLAATTAYFAYTAAQAGDRADAAGPSETTRQEVMDLGRQYAAQLATYDSADYADLDRRIREISTPEFAKRYIQSSQDARRGNTAARGVSKAESNEAGLQSISDTKAVVLVTLDQTVTAPDVSDQLPQGIPYQSRVKVTLEQRDGQWLLADFDTV